MCVVRVAVWSSLFLHVRSSLMSSGVLYAVTRVFFFQAEDGIRDLVRSRGLGDVYKRQTARNEGQPFDGEVRIISPGTGGAGALVYSAPITPVSYTHLTLPTSDLG